MNFQPVLLWSDLLIWLLLAVMAGFAWLAAKNDMLRMAWRRVGASRPGMAAATLLLAFLAIGLLDSLHYRPQLPTQPGEKMAYGVEVLSALDKLLSGLRKQNEKTYSEPLATRLYAKETVELPGGGSGREFPRLKYGGAHLGDDESGRTGDVLLKMLLGWGLALISMLAVTLAVCIRLARRAGSSVAMAWRSIWRGECGFAWDAVLATLAALLLAGLPLLALSANYHVFGTDKVGQDVFFQILKSVRTALLIGVLPTLVTLPLAMLFGLAAGYFGGWVDDVVQYIYTVLSSIPGVLLIAAAVLMMQVVIDTHPQWFATAAERADLRLLALCLILGMTSWTSLCRLLRGETLKLRELEYIQAARAFGVPDWRVLLRHVLPNVMHIVIISVAMGFSGLVLSEAVLSYVGVGVDPSMISFGTMINNARLELGREPVVWWSLLAAFVAMFMLVLAANLFADAVRDAFDPRAA